MNKYALWLNHFSTFNHDTPHKLIQLFGDVSLVYENLMDEDILAELTYRELIKEETAEEIREFKGRLSLDDWIDLHIQDMYESGVNAVTQEDENYPPQLLHIHEPPLALYYRGHVELMRAAIRRIAVIGTRRPTAYGLEMTRMLVTGLSENGVSVVSGMALGVDGAAHRAAIEAHMSGTVAVLGGGVDICYPQRNFDIYRETIETGLVVSEYPPGTAHLSVHFPQRNRIISGLSDGLLVIEAGMKSGTLITADRGLEQGRTIYAVPGRVGDSCSVGTNHLIRQGATLITCAEDILSDLYGDEVGRRRGKNRKGVIDSLSVPEMRVFSKLTYTPMFIDDVVRAGGMGVRETMSVIDKLERRGVVRRVEHGYFIRNI